MNGSLTLTLGGTIELLLRPAPPAWSAVISVRYEGFTATVKGVQSMAYTLPFGMFVGTRIDYVDSGGHPAQVDGPIVWASSDETIVTVEADAADDHLCTVTSATEIGQCQVTATADADLGAGITTLVCLLDVTVIAGEAVGGTISIVGEAAPITPPP
jgi:hypothetical protein